MNSHVIHIFSTLLIDWDIHWGVTLGRYTILEEVIAYQMIVSQDTIFVKLNKQWTTLEIIYYVILI